MTCKHKDPKDYCCQCGARYGIADESCPACGFDPIEEHETQTKAESDFHVWENERPDNND